jgi:hypothetical protein
MDALRPGYESASGQLILDGLPAGPAGEAGLTPVTGMDLAFDRVDGHLVRVIVDDDARPAAELLTRLFGPHALDSFPDSTGAAGAPLSPDAGLCRALSSLARLDAAQATSPGLGSSPWWAVEGAVLAERAGLRERAIADAARAVRGLARGRLTVTDEAARMAIAAAGIAAETDPDSARRLQERIVVGKPGKSDFSRLDAAAEVKELSQGCADVSSPRWALDPGFSRVEGLRFGLTPHSDLLVRPESDNRLLVQATLAPGADEMAGCSWRARLVDPEMRRILARADFRPEGSVIRAVLALPFPLDELPPTWIEVTGGSEPSVSGARAHWIRRALRWADAALRAERAPAGLAPQSTRQDWAALAVLSWERARRDWTAAGDHGRAEAVLAPRTPLAEPAYLAEVLGESSSWLLDDGDAAIAP